MNYKSLSYIPLFAIAVMSSCSNDNEINQTKSEYVNSVRVTVEDFKPEPTTRTAYTVDGSGFHFQWVDGDALGIYPVGGDQVKFPISNGDGSATATFDGGAWKLRSEYQYAAYYPFSANNYTVSESALSASFTDQTQNGNGSTAHLGAYDYLACAATEPDVNGGVDLTMKHLGAFVRLQLTMPKADTYSSIVLESDGAEFVTAGTFDLTAATPAITPTTTSSTYTINLTNVATTEKNQVITVYAIVAPADLITSNITVTVHGTGQTTYVQTVPGKNFAARSAYNIAIESFPSGTNASGEDVSWEEPSTTGIVNGHEWVDLGLSSGLKWATCNVGASKPEEHGDYYAWGETEPYYMEGHSQDAPCTNWKTGKTGYNFESYFDFVGYVPIYRENGDIYGYDMIFRKYGEGKKDVLDPEDDVAHVKWGGNWRMPTCSELHELGTECQWVWTAQNEIYGYKVTGPNGNFIFLPAAQRFNEHGAPGYAGPNSINSWGYYWSSSMRNIYGILTDHLATELQIFSSGLQWGGTVRCSGNSVRPVCS